MNQKNNNRTIACIIARTVSTRLPLKVLRTVYDNVTMLDFIIQRTKMASLVDEVILCTSREHVDDILEDVARKNKIKIFRGEADAVIDRMVKVGEQQDADVLIRITGDNVFSSHEYLDDQIRILIENDLDYIRLIDVPFGGTAEVIKRSALENCYASIDPEISEYLTLFIYDPSKYKCGVLKVHESDYSHLTLTVDTPGDLSRTREILKHYQHALKEDIKMLEIVEVIQKNEVPHSIYIPSGQVKLPFNKSVSFAEFSSDMKNRAEESTLFTL